MKPTANKEADKSSSYYQLHTEAVDTLVNATAENTPRYSKEELEKYRSSHGKWRLPETLKVLLIKVWFYGAVCFFVFWGLGLYVTAQLDLYFIAAVILGMVTDLLINRFLRFTEKMPGGSRRWVMVSRRGTMGFVMNLFYGFVLLFLVITIYYALNTFLQLLFRPPAPVLNVEPILFGVFTAGADTLCILIRQTFASILADAGCKTH
ncbi:MAG: hypothetical protein IKJ26_06210 [Clostridia bacterium]|nr:hypothetical protein [Clostridia bacterium]